MKRKFFRIRLLVTIVCALLLVASGGLSAWGAAAPTKSAVYKIVALGDSLAAGYEPGLTEQSVPYGYADRLYEQALYRGRAKLSNFGVLGLRTEGLNRLLEGAAAGKSLQASDIQDFSMYTDERIAALANAAGAKTKALKAALAEADLVVITVGANDFSHYLKSLLSLSMDNIDKSLHDELPGLIETYRDEAETALRQVLALAPKAKVLLADQYLPLTKVQLRFLDTPLPATVYDDLYTFAVEPIAAAVDDLAAELQEEDRDVEAVHVGGLFKGKEGSMSHIAVKDYHPTQSGYEAIAQAFAAAVWTEYRTPSQKTVAPNAMYVAGGKEIKLGSAAAVKKDVVYVAAADAAKLLGAELKWTAKTKTATFKKSGKTLVLAAGAKTATVAGKKQNNDAPAFMQKSGKTDVLYVPLTAAAQWLGAEVVYRPTLRTYFFYF